MAATRWTPHTLIPIAFVLLGVGLAALGFARDAWWPLAGATTALAYAAWTFTEAPR